MKGWFKSLFWLIVFNGLDLLLLPLRIGRVTGGRRRPWPPRRILAIHTEGIGNLVMATPLLAALRRQWPQVEIALAIQPQPGKARLLAHTDLVNETILFPSDDALATMRDRAFLNGLASRNFDLAVLCFPFNRRWKLAFVRMLGRLRCEGAALRFGASDFLNWSRRVRFHRPVPHGRHEVEINLALAEALGIDPPDKPRTVVGVSDGDRSKAGGFLQESGLAVARPLIGVHPGSLGGSDYKRWPAEKHVELIGRLHKTRGGAFVLFQGPDDKEAVEPIACRLAVEPHAVLAGASLPETAAVMDRCDLVISIDSGLGHIAAAVGTPTVSIFGPGDPRRVRPWGDRVRVVRRNDLGPPAIELWRPVDRRRARRLVEAVTVEAVYDAACELLDMPDASDSSGG